MYDQVPPKPDQTGETEPLPDGIQRWFLCLLLSVTFSTGVVRCSLASVSYHKISRSKRDTGAQEYAILMPTVWQYVRSLGGRSTYLGLVLAGFSLSKCISAFALGYWSDKRPMREAFVFSFAVGVAGNILYGIAGGAGFLHLILIGRLVAGIGAANTTLVQAYIARSSAPAQRTRLMSMCRGASLLGISSGPVLNLALINLDNKGVCWHGFCLNSWTAAGYVMAVINLILGFMFAVFFLEPPEQRKAVKQTLKYDESGHSLSNSPPTRVVIKNKPNFVPSGHVQFGGDRGTGRFNDSYSSSPMVHEDNKTSSSRISDALKVVLIERGGWCNLCLSFMTGFEFASLETSVTPITATQFGWGTQENSYFFAGVTGVALCAIATTIWLDGRQWTSPRGIVAFAQVSTGTGFALGLWLCGPHRIRMEGLLLLGGFLVFGVVLQSSPSQGVFSTKIGKPYVVDLCPCMEFLGVL